MCNFQTTREQQSGNRASTYGKIIYMLSFFGVNMGNERDHEI